MSSPGRRLVPMTRLLLILLVLAACLTSAPAPLFAADCEPAESICRWYEEQSGDFCDYLWCMQDHASMDLIPWSCVPGWGQAQLMAC